MTTNPLTGGPLRQASPADSAPATAWAWARIAEGITDREVLVGLLGAAWHADLRLHHGDGYGGTTGEDLARLLYITGPAAEHALRRLNARGLVEPTRPTDDVARWRIPEDAFTVEVNTEATVPGFTNVVVDPELPEGTAIVRSADGTEVRIEGVR